MIFHVDQLELAGAKRIVVVDDLKSEVASSLTEFSSKVISFAISYKKRPWAPAMPHGVG